MKFEGIMTAMVTPLDENGVIVEESFRELIRFQIKHQVQNILILGGTGEYTKLNLEEKKRAIDIAVSEVNGCIPVVVGIISPGLNEAIELGKYSKLAGAEAIMVVTPYYGIPTQKGLKEYYQEIDQAVGMPLILYNIPYRTNVNLLPESVEELVQKIPNIVGIKECTPNMGQVVNLIRRVGDKIVVLCGEEFFAVSEFIIGAKGAVMASANIIPDVWVKMWRLVNEKDYDVAVKMNEDYFPFFNAIFSELHPGPLKVAMQMFGLPAEKLSAPLVAPSENTIIALKESMKELGMINNV